LNCHPLKAAALLCEKNDPAYQSLRRAKASRVVDFMLAGRQSAIKDLCLFGGFGFPYLK